VTWSYKFEQALTKIDILIEFNLNVFILISFVMDCDL